VEGWSVFFSTMRRWITSTILLALFGCGGKGNQAPPIGPPAEVEVKAGAPAPMTASTVDALDATGGVSVLGVTSKNNVLAVSGGEIYEVDTGMLVHRSLYAESGEPTSTGEVHAITPRAAGGAWIAADNGVFLLDTLFVTKASFSTGMGPVRSTSEVSTGPLTGLWVAGDDGLFRRQGSMLTKYAIPSVDGAVLAIAVEAGGNAALALAGTDAIVLSASGGQITSDRPPLEAGAISSIAAGTGVLYAGSDTGLFRYRPDGMPKWTHFTLAADGEPGKKVRALALDVAVGDLWMRTDDGVVRLSGDTLGGLDASTVGTSTVPAIAIDEVGDLWAAGGNKLEHVGTSGMTAAVTFAHDVSPWLGMHCTQCHGNETQNFQDYNVFAPLADMALERVKSGDMPRCDGGTPCPSDKHLTEMDYTVLEQWIREGKPK
jgi:hypothetical protein